MELIVKASAKEIADLLTELKGQLYKKELEETQPFSIDVESFRQCLRSTLLSTLNKTA